MTDAIPLGVGVVISEVNSADWHGSCINVALRALGFRLEGAIVAYVIKVIMGNGESAWVKSRCAPYRMGSRDDATVFANYGQACRVFDEMPRWFRKSGLQIFIETAGSDKMTMPSL